MKCLLIFLLLGCAQFTVNYEYPDGTKVHGTYFRFGSQEFKDFHITGDSGLQIDLGYQKADAETLNEILRLSREIVTRLP